VSAMAFWRMWYASLTAVMLSRLLWRAGARRFSWWMYFVATGMALCLLAHRQALH
jgi:hypothetical protein